LGQWKTLLLRSWAMCAAAMVCCPSRLDYSKP
jgi:hypothetical protein